MHIPEEMRPPSVPHRPGILAGLGAGIGAFLVLVLLALVTRPDVAFRCGFFLLLTGGVGTIFFLSRNRVRLAVGLAAGTILGAVMLVALLILMSAAVPG